MNIWFTVALKDPKTYRVIAEVETKSTALLAAIARVRTEFPGYAYNARPSKKTHAAG